MTTPPRIALWFLTRRIAPADRDEVIGDLNEQFVHHVATRGGAWAARWYLRQAVLLSWRLSPHAAYLPTTRRRQMSMHDLRYAVRRLARQPAATLVAIATLGCAIGAAVAAWSVLSAVLLRPLAVADPGRLVVVGGRSARTDAPPVLNTAHFYSAYPAIRDSGTFEQVAAGARQSLIVAQGVLSAERSVYFASHNFFDTLGVRLPLGRGFTAADDRPGSPLVTVLSDRLWRRVLHADSKILGRQITVVGRAAVIVGVAPANFRGLSLAEAPDLYLPLHTISDVGTKGWNYFDEPSREGQGASLTWLSIVGRLQPGVDHEQATSRLASFQGERWARGQRFQLTPISTAAIPEAARPGMAQFARLLVATVTLLLLVGCLTVGMLLLIRTEARRHEFAMCLALGSTRTTLAAGIAFEGALLSMAGAAVAVPTSWLMISGIGAFQLPGDINIDLLNIGADARALGAAIAAAVGTSLLIAIVAGVFGFSADVAAALRARTGATPRLRRRRTRSALVVGQVAVALVLLAGAGLFLRSLAAALNLNPGFETGRIATTTISLVPYGYTPDRANDFFEDLRASLTRSPTIASVSFSIQQGGMTPSGRLFINDEPRQFPSLVAFFVTDEEYFRTVGLPVIQGRDFAATDRAGAPNVAIVSASFGRLLATGGNPLGHRIKINTPDPIEVVGVVPDVVTNVTVLEPLRLYRPLAQVPGPGLVTRRGVVVRAHRDAAAAIQDTLRAIHGLDPAIAPPLMLTMDEQMAGQMRPQRFGATVLGALGVIAFILTLFGIYVLAESMAVLRRREMGIRAALGANRRQLGVLVFADTGILIALGLAAGLGLVWLGTDLIRAFLFKVHPLDPITLGGVALAILVLALTVCAKPALRAARVDLAQVLREE